MKRARSDDTRTCRQSRSRDRSVRSLALGAIEAESGLNGRCTPVVSFPSPLLLRQPMVSHIHFGQEAVDSPIGPRTLQRSTNVSMNPLARLERPTGGEHFPARSPMGLTIQMLMDVVLQMQNGTASSNRSCISYSIAAATSRNCSNVISSWRKPPK